MQVYIFALQFLEFHPEVRVLHFKKSLIFFLCMFFFFLRTIDFVGFNLNNTIQDGLNFSKLILVTSNKDYQVLVYLTLLFL